MYRLVTVVAAIVLAGSASAGIGGQESVKPLPTIEVTAPKDVADVQALNDSLAELSRKATACVAEGAKPETCPCRFSEDVARVRKGYETLIKRHPDWKDQLVSYDYKNKESRRISGTLVLENLRRQLDALKC